MELQYFGRASPSTMEEEEALEREKEETKGVDQKALLPPLYIGGPRGGGAGPRRSNLLGGAAAKGGFPPPKAPRGAFH